MPLYLSRHTEPGRQYHATLFDRAEPDSAWQHLATPTLTLAASAPARLTRFAAGSTQTFPNPTELWVALDGYVSNRRALRSELPSLAQSTDLELIAHAFRQRLLHRLEGAFVLVVVEPAEGRMQALRDRLGGRRLCWTRQGDQLTMATRAADLIRSGAASACENPDAMTRFFALQDPAPGSTPFAEIEELRPGQFFHVDERIRLGRHPFDFGQSIHAGAEEWRQRFLDILEQSVQAAVGTRGPVASMLSGGLDSGPVTALAHRWLTDQQRTLVPVSWLLAQYPKADETRPIRTLGQHLDCELRTFDGSAMLPFRTLNHSFISPELPSYNAFRELVTGCYREAAKAGCRIILNGHAGDRIYPMRRLLWIDHWQRGDLGPLARRVLQSLRPGLSWWHDPALRYPLSRAWKHFRPTRPTVPEWLTGRTRRRWQPDQPAWPPEAAQHRYPEYARQLLGPGMTVGLAHENDFPTRYGIERRDPYQNETLLRLMLEMPHAMSFRDGYDKWIMRDAMQGILPDRLRLKPRTGRLGTFFDAGFDRHRGEIHNLLFERQRAWQHHVKPDYVEQALTRKTPDAVQKKIITRCVGYALWQKHWTTPNTHP